MARRRPSADGLELDVAVVCAGVLDRPVGPDDDLWELGLDSLAAVDLAAGCSDLGWGTLEPTVLLTAATPDALADELRARARASFAPRSSDVVVLTATGTRTPVVAFPGAGSTALAYRWLARALGADQPFRVVEAHGLHTSGAPDRTLPDQVDRATGVVRAEIPAGPVVLLGHSAGGAVAHEVGLRLATAGGPVPAVVLLDAVLPDALARPPASRRLRAAVAGAGERLRRARRVRRPGPPSADPRRFAAFETIGVRALAGYRPTAGSFPEWHLRVAGSAAAEGWPAGQRVREVGGDHRSMLTPPHVDGLARWVAEAVDGAGR